MLRGVCDSRLGQDQGALQRVRVKCCSESGGDRVKAETTLSQDGASSTTKTEVDANYVTEEQLQQPVEGVLML